MPIASINPATGEKLKEFSPFGDAEIEKRLSRAEKAFSKYRRTTFIERSELLHAATELLFQEKEKFAEIITMEMGKLFRDSVAEIEKCARGCRFYAENGARFLEEEPAQTDAAESYVEYQPLGPVLAIMPWNFPFWQVFRFAAPALMAGNIGLLKHASNVPQCAHAIEEIFCRAGFEEGTFQTLLIEPEQVEKLIVDPRVKAVTVTGSEKAGVAVASAAAREIKKSVLELGGSDAFIVMPSADFESALNTAVKARTINTGQSCIAAKRFIVADEIYERFLEQFVDRMRALKVGDPMDPETELGPLATEQILQGVHDQVQKTFFRVPDAYNAVELANDTTFGLGSSAWTKDREEQKLFASELDAGMVFINAMVASDPRLPFGGVKRSGFGRELGMAGIREFTNTKTIWIS